MNDRQRAADDRGMRETIATLLRGETPVSEWRDFFDRHSGCLAASVPLKVYPVSAIAAGREPANFVLYPHQGAGGRQFGAFETRLPQGLGPQRARRRLATAADADSALALLQADVPDEPPTVANREIICVGSRWYLFVVIQMRADQREQLEADLVGANPSSLPEGLQLLDGAALDAALAAPRPPAIVVLAPVGHEEREERLGRERPKPQESSMCG